MGGVSGVIWRSWRPWRHPLVFHAFLACVGVVRGIEFFLDWATVENAGQYETEEGEEEDEGSR